MRRVIFVSGPFRAESQAQMAAHTMTAQAAALRLAQLGWAVYCPHTNIGHAFGQLDEADAEAINDAFLAKSDAILLLPGWGQSIGARRELEQAKARSLIVFRSLGEVMQWGRP